MVEFITISLTDLKKSGAAYHHDMLRSALSAAGCEMLKMQDQYSSPHLDREEKWDLNKVPVFTEDAVLFLKPHLNACRLFETQSHARFDENIIGKGISFLQFIDWVDYTYAEKFGERPPAE